MERNISDLVKQMNIVSEEHEQVLRELKNMQSVVNKVHKPFAGRLQYRIRTRGRIAGRDKGTKAWKNK